MTTEINMDLRETIAILNDALSWIEFCLERESDYEPADLEAMREQYERIDAEHSRLCGMLA